jgi:hypothetical protein
MRPRCVCHLMTKSFPPQHGCCTLPPAGKHQTKYVLCLKLDEIANGRWPAKVLWWLIHVNRRCSNIKQIRLNISEKMP